MVKKVAVLTSGGDAPGMNACVRAVVRSGLKSGLDMFVVYEGYRGLVEDNIEQVDRSFVSDTINRGGTILKSAPKLNFAWASRAVPKVMFPFTAAISEMLFSGKLKIFKFGKFTFKMHKTSR